MRLARSWRAKTKHGQDAGRTRSSAACPTEDAAGRRFAAARTAPGSTDRTRAILREFLDQAHIRTICTRVQFAEGTAPGEKCPAGSAYGYAKAITPLLDEPLQGPIVDFTGHNGKVHDFNPVVKADCGGKGRRHRATHR